MKKNTHIIFLTIIIFLLAGVSGFAVGNNKPEKKDSLAKAKSLLNQAKVESSAKEIRMTIRNVDISAYPMVKLIVEAYNVYGQPVDTLVAKNLSVLENGVEKQVISVERISTKENVPIDFCFVIDQTGTMQSYFDAMRKKIRGFTTFLRTKGIDYTLSLVLFSDFIEGVNQPTSDVNEFTSWLAKVKAQGGGDAKENALKGLDRAVKKIRYRPSANKVIVLISDAPYHQVGEDGQGKTRYTTQSIVKELVKNEIRVFCIVPPRIEGYQVIAQETRGNIYDMDYPFEAILNNFSSQLTNLYALKYKSSEPAIPDSIDIALIDEKKQVLTRKTIPIIELGRKLIIENMLFSTGRAALPKRVKELDVMTQFMKNRKNVVIMVEGHTDSIGSYKINDKLSLQRANAVKQYLLKRGISKYRIKTKGYGERRPISSNKTAFGRKLNRRTEIIIIAK